MDEKAERMDIRTQSDIVDEPYKTGDSSMLKITHQMGRSIEDKQPTPITYRRWEALEALKEAHKAEGNKPVLERIWRNAFYGRTDAEGWNKQKAFIRSRRALLDAGMVKEVSPFHYVPFDESEKP